MAATLFVLAESIAPHVAGASVFGTVAWAFVATVKQLRLWDEMRRRERRLSALGDRTPPGRGEK